VRQNFAKLCRAVGNLNGVITLGFVFLTDIAGIGSNVLRVALFSSFLGLLSACGGSGSTPPVVDDTPTVPNVNAPVDGVSETDPVIDDNSVNINDDNGSRDELNNSDESNNSDNSNSDDPNSLADTPDSQNNNVEDDQATTPENNTPTESSIEPPANDGGINAPTSGFSDPDSIEPNRVLAPLPSPSLTPAPGPESEPIRASGPVSTVSQFFLVRNPTGDPEDTSTLITEEEFAAGPLPPVIQIPDHVDTTTNQAPYFDNLTDVEVFAGQTLNLRLRPLDNDGGIPGLFPHDVPAGAQYVDNFDGSRSLIWSPLQPDVGIREFIITATDPVEPYYRTVRTVRIKVSMPSDTSSIVNLPPVVNLIRPATVRVNDPVVLYIKADDQNGTVPALEVINPPPGATIIPHFDDPKFTIVRFVPARCAFT